MSGTGRKISKRLAPGFSWRILAHERTKPTIRAGYTGRSFDVRCGKRWVPPADADTGQRRGFSRVEFKEGAWKFDELCIDDWFHLEQMDERDWWLGIGNGEDYWHLNVHIDPDGQAHVLMEKQ